MNTTADLKLLGVAQVNGRPLACTACGNTFSLEVHKRGLFETSPAWICCLACGAGHESDTITTGLIDAVLAGWNPHQDLETRDEFTGQWRGTVMTGELMPTIDLHQVIGAAKAAYEVAAPEVKRRWRAKKKMVKAPWKVAKSRAGKAVGEAVGTVKSKALATAWTLQTGGAGAPPAQRPRSRCTVKGCRQGWLTIKTRVHSSTGKAQQMRVRCAVCRRSN
ncbi:hypothetical protein ACPF8X_03235 [Streptomyces sp. G35A]